MKQKLSKFTRALLVCLLFLLLLFNLWQLAARTVFKQDLPMVFGFSPIIVLSGSMEPTFSVNDMIVIRRQDSYAVGDVVTFDDGGFFTTHRIVSQSPEGFVTQGDANNTEDSGYLSPAQIKGAVVFTIPAVGAFLLFLRTPLGILLLVLAGPLLVFLPDMAKKA